MLLNVPDDWRPPKYSRKAARDFLKKFRIAFEENNESNLYKRLIRIIENNQKKVSYGTCTISFCSKPVVWWNLLDYTNFCEDHASLTDKIRCYHAWRLYRMVLIYYSLKTNNLIK